MVGSSKPKKERKKERTQRRQQDNGHFSSDDKRIVAKQTLTQTLKDKLRPAREEGAPAHAITGLGESYAKEKHELLKLPHLAVENCDRCGSLVSICPKPQKNFTSLHVGPASTVQN